MAAVPRSNHDAAQALPQGFELALGASSSRRVKLRRALHLGAPLGITIFLKEGDRLARIEQFDIATSLDSVTRPLIEDLLLEVYSQLGAGETFDLGMKRLQRMHDEGLCISCQIAPVKRS